MLCSHSVRDGPRRRYIDLGSKLSDARSQREPAFRRSRKRQGDSNDTPITSVNVALSRCHPMVEPAEYSRIST